MIALHSAQTFLREWYCQLQEACRAEDPEESHVSTICRLEDLRLLEHFVLEAMSRLLPGSDVDMALIEPTKSRDKLDEDRLEEARGRLDNPRPVVVMERPGGGKARVLDGNHRYYAAEDARRETLPAVRVTPETLAEQDHAYPRRLGFRDRHRSV